MCDFVPGEIIITFPRHPALVGSMTDWFSEYGEFQHAVLIESMGAVIESMNLTSRSYAYGGVEMWRIQVPPGQEHFKMNFLRERYMENLLSLRQAQNISEQQFLSWLFRFSATPNSLVSATADLPFNNKMDVRLTEYHVRYKNIIGLSGDVPGKGEGTTIGILDSGISNEESFNIVKMKDFASRQRFGRPGEDTAPDQTGHGTVVASIIRDVAPRAKLVVYKVLDEKGRGTEWEAIAGLLTIEQCNIVNMSLQFGHNKLDCPTCGRSTASSRSIVFERVLELLSEHGGNPLVVAAAGNLYRAELTFPARFSSVVAVGSLNAGGARSSFSNYRATDHLGDYHSNLFFLPGGEREPTEEAVAYADGSKPFRGTSFSCAYASAVITILRPYFDRTDLLQHLRITAVKDIQDLTEADMGNGRMVLSLPAES
jgi:subtilisin family serine protease